MNVCLINFFLSKSLSKSIFKAFIMFIITVSRSIDYAGNYRDCSSYDIADSSE